MIKTIKSIDSFGIHFTDGCVLEDEHYQDCCENHYLDWEQLSSHSLAGERLDFTSEETLFERVEGYGIRLILVDNFPVSVAGYGDNNGYYSDNIDLVLKDVAGNHIMCYDVSECQEVS